MPTSRLTNGSFGPRVTQLQKHLRRAGFPIPEHELKRSFFGPGTRDALRKWQKQNGLRPSGEGDEETLRKLASGETHGGIEPPDPLDSPSDSPGSPSPPSTGEPRTNTGPESTPGSMIGRTGRSIASTLRFGDGGIAVDALQRALKSLGFDIADSEEKNRRFGASTLKALTAFQKERELDPTGVLDTATSAALGSEVGGDRDNPRPLPRRSRRVLRNLATLALSTKNLKAQDRATAEEIDRRLVRRLKDRLVDLLEQPSTAMVAAIHGLEIDLEQIRDLEFSEVVFSRIAPSLAQNENLEAEFHEIVDSGIEPEVGTVGQLLGLDQDVRESEALADLVNTARNQALGSIFELSESAIDALGEIDLLESDDVVLQLEKAEKLTQGQGQQLRVAADLARLTGDNFKAIRAIRGSGVREPKDLVTRNQTDWIRFIKDNEIEPPAGETTESYAALLDAGVERAFPTTYALNRYTAPTPDATFNMMSVLDRLPSVDGPVFVDGGVRPDLDLAALPEAEAEKVRANLDELSHFANRYSGLGVADILNNRDLPASARRDKIQRRQTALAKAWSELADLDLDLANFTTLEDPTAQMFTVELKQVDAAMRPHVRRALMSFQRAYRLAGSSADAEKLLSAGLDSSSRIAALDHTDELVSRTGLSRASALNIRARAVEAHTRVLHFVTALESAISHSAADPQVLDEAGTGSITKLINVLKGLPAYSELFGPQNYCKCRHCQSILGPAAYFVDLMRFIEKKISNSNFVNKGRSDHPLYLKNRRSDLWTIPLTCTNTDDPVIYLTIVNEVLESYLENVAPLQRDVFEFLATEARSSCNQPFNLPHAEMLLYLKHLGVDLSEVSALFDPDRQAATYTLLGISPQELRTLETAEPDAVRIRFSKPLSTDLAVHDAAALCRKLSVDRETLGRLLKSDFVLANAHVETELESLSDDLTGFEEHIRIELPEVSNPETALRAFLDRLHRFVRLVRALGWTPEEVQLAIEALQTGATVTPDADPGAFGAILDADLLSGIAGLKQLTQGLSLSVSESVALCHRIPEKPPGPDGTSLWSELFGERTQLMVRHPALGNTEADEPEVSPDFGLLQSALKIEKPDLLALLRRTLPEPLLATGSLKKRHLVQLYQAARLARALGLSQDDLAGLERIIPSLNTAGSSRTTSLILEAEPTVADRLSALLETMSVVRDFDGLKVGLGELLDLVSDSADSEGNRDLAKGFLSQVKAALQADDRIWLKAGDFSKVEGVTPEAARAMLEYMASRETPWLVRSGDGRFRLTDAVGEDPDTDTLREILSASGAPLAGTDESDHARDFLVTSIVDVLEQHHPIGLIKDELAQVLPLSGAVLRAFTPFLTHLQPLSEPEAGLANWLQSEQDTPPEILLNYVAEVVRLKHLWVDTIEADGDTITFVADHQGLFGIEPGAKWSWSSLHRTAFFVSQRRGSEARIQALQDALTAWDGTLFPASAGPNLAIHFDLTTAQMEALLEELPQAEEAFDSLQRIGEGVRLTGRTGLDPSALRQLVAESYQGISSARELLLGAMRTKHPEKGAWESIYQPFLETIEGLKRDALVDRILSRRELKFENAHDIYYFFLLDPEMDGCFRTSRVKNAISSCQLYVQRCLMGLEKSDENGEIFRVKVKGGSKTRQEWTWRKSYRVWEANRKVFLYPENYMLPDLRDDRSHIFRIAEQELLQGNLDKDAIEQVFRRYLSEFVQVGNLEIVHVLYEPNLKEYLLFGRTRQEPFRYFMRRFNGKHRWEPWEPINLDIGARSISAVKRRGRLHLFWTNVELDGDAEKIKQGQPKGSSGSSGGENDKSRETMPISITYSVLDEAGNWSSPQDILYYNLVLTRAHLERNLLLPISDRIYVEFPHPSGSAGDGDSGIEKFVRLIHPVHRIDYSGTFLPGLVLRQVLGFLRGRDNKTVRRNGTPTSPLGDTGNFYSWPVFRTPGLRFGHQAVWRGVPHNMGSTAEVDYTINEGYVASSGPGLTQQNVVLEFDRTDFRQLRLLTVQRRTREFVLRMDDGQYLTKLTGKPGYDTPTPQFGSELTSALALAKWKLISLDSTWPEALSRVLYSHGVSSLLTPKQQLRAEPRSWEKISYRWLGQVKWTDEDLLSEADHVIAQFSGPHGSYLWEIFFHLPFLIAYTLNSIGKFEEADRWYRHIFNPVASGDDPGSLWRFVVFRTLKLPKLRSILSQKAAIRAYKDDPFNPFAIARLRPSAFEKTIVMRYIDNLLDWGDELFSRDTRESINEALLLYTMAADLLGERPVETGECEVAESLTYNDISLRNVGGEFLVELENLVYFYVSLDGITPVSPARTDLEFVPFRLPGSDPDGPPSDPIGPGGGFSVLKSRQVRMQPLATVRAARMAAASIEEKVVVPAARNLALEPNIPDPDPPKDDGVFNFTVMSGDDSDPGGSLQESRTLGFCVPPNDMLLGYWDRVEDRLYKIRHCMNIEGVVRQLPLWQPPIDPMLLVRAKAAGLDLDQVLALINEQPPHHRFEVLLARARRFAATTQQLGSQLLGVLERKDENELVLLKSVHEDTILKLSRRQKQDAISEAKETRAHLDSLETTIRARLDYYTTLLSSDREFAMSKEEKAVLDDMQAAKELQDDAGEEESKAQRFREIGPQWTAGGSGSFGQDFGKPIVRTTADLSAVWGSVNVQARFQRRAFRHRDAASKFTASAGMSSTRAGYARRQKEWAFQRKLARREIAALEPQKAAADIRIALAEKELENHDAQIKNSQELYEFAKDRFTGLGLYTYLSTTLSSLHREAYNMAFKMAQTTERAYQFEIGENDFFLKMDNWDASRSGLLAAERLLLQLQAMEASYVERDRRRQEVTLPCSLAQIDPDALVRLRQTGRAEFSLPEWWFDLSYPGQYRRLLQAVRLTLPCITGPYSSVAARLTLVDSAVRSAPRADDQLTGVQVGRNTSISTSTANSDAGVFELRFDAPKNPPFKGAGAISSWVLELPALNRVFDYSTISDAILELSYSADDDGLLRTAVEGSNDTQGSLDRQLDDGLVRIISLRHEFPTEFHRLFSTPPEGSGGIQLNFRKSELFPYWLRRRRLEATEVDLALEPRGDARLLAADLRGVVALVFNGEELSDWAELSILGSLPAVSTSNTIELGDDPTEVVLAASFPEDLEVRDILIRLVYGTHG